MNLQGVLLRKLKNIIRNMTEFLGEDWRLPQNHFFTYDIICSKEEADDINDI